jgi:riboflavin kinase/FMN adenylyltransferase
MAKILSIGNFDGVHRGHQALISRLLELKKGIPESILAVLTFEPHPIEILRPGILVERLTPPPLKEKILRDLGVDEVVFQTFDNPLAAMTPEDFFRKILIEKLQATHIAVGENFHFGASQAGDARKLEELGKIWGPKIHIIPSRKEGGEVVSSSRIRKALLNGEIKLAQELLGRPHRLLGTVVPGEGRGRGIGIPTANLRLTATCKKSCIPKPGVYLSRSYLEDNPQGQASVTNIGFRPTVDPQAKSLSVETHILSAQGDLYGKTMSVEFIDRIRDEIRFPSIEALREQIQKDIAFARTYLAEK